MANSDDLSDSVDGHDPTTARLLFALTSLYVQRPVHTAEEQRQYAELALRLVDKVGPATRAAVAARLGRHLDAPAEVMERLGGWRPGDRSAGRLDGLPGPADDGPGEVPPHADMVQVALDQPALDQVALDQPLADRPAAGDPSPESDSPHSGGQRLANGENEPAPARSGNPPPAALEPLTPEAGEAFFAAAPEERRRMLSLFAARGNGATAPEGSRRFHVRVDTAAWRSGSDAFARDFERLIDSPVSLCERILNDPSGEPMVVAARATGMPVAMLQRILLLAGAATNHSVQRVHELTELYHALDSRTARDLLAAWRARVAGQPPQTALTVVTSPPVAMNLRARFRALNARLEKQAAGPPDRRPDKRS
jgi:hypothetical protein